MIILTALYASENFGQFSWPFFLGDIDSFNFLGVWKSKPSSLIEISCHILTLRECKLTSGFH